MVDPEELGYSELTDSGRGVSIDSSTALPEAAKRGFNNVINFIFEKESSIDPSILSEALSNAAAAGKTETVMLLLRKGASKSAIDLRLLNKTLSHGHAETALLLWRIGINFQQCKNYEEEVWNCTESTIGSGGSSVLLEELLKKCSYNNEQKIDLLERAINCKDSEGVKCLLNFGGHSLVETLEVDELRSILRLLSDHDEGDNEELNRKKVQDLVNNILIEAQAEARKVKSLGYLCIRTMGEQMLRAAQNPDMLKRKEVMDEIGAPPGLGFRGQFKSHAFFSEV